MSEHPDQPNAYEQLERDRFEAAKVAMQGLIAAYKPTPRIPSWESARDAIVFGAVEVADALLAELAKEKTK